MTNVIFMTASCTRMKAAEPKRGCGHSLSATAALSWLQMKARAGLLASLQQC